MPTITLFNVVGELVKENLIQKINENGRKFNMSACENKYSKNEIIISYFFEENIEEKIKNILEEQGDEVISIIKQNGKNKILRKLVAFLDIELKILEVYRGPDKVTEDFVDKLSSITGVKLVPVKFTAEELESIYKTYSYELKQAMFKNVDGMFYNIFRGNFLESNKRFLLYLQNNKQSLRVISIRPSIKFLKGGRYQVTINGDKGTIKFSLASEQKWRPRFEIRQIVGMCMKVKRGLNESLLRHQHTLQFGQKTN